MSRDDYIYGLHTVATALDTQGGVTELWVDAARTDRRMRSLLEVAQSHGVKVHHVERRELEQMVGAVRHQGVVALGAAPSVGSVADLDEILARAGHNVFLLVLDGVQDPHNLGACLRTADAAGVHAVIVPKDRASGLTPTARKVAAGAAERVPFIQVTNLARTLRDLRERGVWLVGAALGTDKTLYDVDLKGPIAMVLGAEGAGIRRLTAELCDFLVTIPMAGRVESLNVSVATGVCLYEAVRQRRN